MNSLKVTHTLSHGLKSQVSAEPKTVIYGISWSPDDSRICCVTANGDLNVWDYEKNKMLITTRPGEKSPIYRVDWHPMNKDYILTGGDKKAFLLKFTPDATKLEVNRKFNHPNIVYGVMWSPMNKYIYIYIYIM